MAPRFLALLRQKFLYPYLYLSIALSQVGFQSRRGPPFPERFFVPLVLCSVRTAPIKKVYFSTVPCLGTGGQNHFFNLHYNGIIGYDIELSEVVEKGEEIDSDYHNTRRNGGAFDKLPK
jgi:hypothetical protein